jgi:ATP-independent RNA helicase DbpA
MKETNANNNIEEASRLFTSVPLRQELINNLISLQFNQMTPIQVEGLPVMLKGADVIAKAETGSGKTAAFALTLLNQLNIDLYAVQALVLCPTRELADQVSQAIRRFARLLPNIKVLNLSGGIPMKPQLDSLRHGAHIIVGTPGRVLKHLNKETLPLKKLKFLVLDEADRMLDMGFVDDIKTIISTCPTQRQTLLFSATYDNEVKKLSKQFMNNPKEIFVEAKQVDADIEQYFYEAQHSNNKFSLLTSILLHYKPSSALIFCNTIQKTEELVDMLKNAGFSAAALNGDMEQPERDLAIIRFANQSCSILVATDVAARGLDIKELPAVINYELAFEQPVHVHRIGRTGRAGHKGLALSITTTADAMRIAAIEENQAQPIIWGNSDNLSGNKSSIPSPEMVTLCISAGKKDKIRPGDILGALTKDAGLAADKIGKIDVGSIFSYIAIHRSCADQAFQYFNNGKLKGRKLSAKKF